MSRWTRDIEGSKKVQKPRRSQREEQKLEESLRKLRTVKTQCERGKNATVPLGPAANTRKLTVDAKGTSE